MKKSINSVRHYPGILLIFCFIILTGLNSGCFHYYYKVSKTPSITPESIQELKNRGKYFLLHDGVSIWYMDSLKIGNNVLSGWISQLPEQKLNSLKSRTSSTRYRIRSQADTPDEVHIYAVFPVSPDSKVQIPLNSLQKIEIYDRDKAATITSWVVGSVLVTGGVVFVVAAIDAGNSLSSPAPSPAPSSGSSSCPFIFSYDGDSYHFAGEIYSGAILPPLERADYLDITGIKPFENFYHILMSNKAREIQYTNLAELYIIDHPKNVNVFIDKYGNIFSTSRIHQPSTVTGLNGNSLVQLVSESDNQSYQSIPVNKEDELMDEVVLTFNVPKNCDQGKLILRARNSLLLDYSIGKFMGLFGDNLPLWQERVSSKPAENFRKWSVGQGIPLSVYLEKNGKWEYQDQFETPGPMAYKDDILNINLTEINGSEVRIKLKSGKLFWDIDRIGMDFSRDSVCDVRIVNPFMATDQDSRNILDLILQDDKKYFIQPNIGDEAELLFQVPELKSNNTRSVFLHTKGHYQILGSEGKTQSITYLRKFRKPENFTRFARDNYFEILESVKN